MEKVMTFKALEPERAREYWRELEKRGRTDGSSEEEFVEWACSEKNLFIDLGEGYAGLDNIVYGVKAQVHFAYFGGVTVRLVRQLSQILDLVARQFKLKWLEARVPEHAGTGRLCKLLGFKWSGVLKGEFLINGELEDGLVFVKEVGQ